MQSGYILQRPVMAFPSYRSNQTISPAPLYPVWGQSGVQMWGPPCYPAWQPAKSWHWKPVPGVIFFVQNFYPKKEKKNFFLQN